MSDVYIPEHDVTKALDDGREVLIAAKGIPVPFARAQELGLIKAAQPQGPSEVKADEQPAEQPAKVKKGA